MNKEEKCKELLEKVKQTPNNILEEAIDNLGKKLNKEDKEHLIKVLTEYKDYIFEFDDDNIKIEHILDHIRELEFQNTALKAEHNHNIDKIKELEQKESILDKVTDKLKELETELKNDGYDYYEKEIHKILNIIEGEKKQ